MDVIKQAALVALVVLLLTFKPANSSGRVVNILKRNGAKLLLNREALATILLRHELTNKRLMIVSIVGSMRKGKSFIMNYPKRYLSSRGWENPAWMGGPETKADDGFTWTKGTKPGTTGIDIWGEIYMVEDKDNADVAVLLMDTQGLFDLETTAENNVKLFAYSSLVSSVQILNFQGFVEERDLQNLQFCSEFAGMAADVEKDLFRLPELMILLQNWSGEDEYEFGAQGGERYLNYVLAPRSGNSALNSIRQNLVSSFQRMKCYLLPHPGLNVTKSSFTGANEEMEPGYLRNVKSFVESIFDSRNLPIKMWHGEAMTSKTLYDFLTACDDVLQSEGMPKVETLAEAYGRTYYTSLLESTLKSYENEIKVHVDNYTVIEETDLLAIHSKAWKNAIQKYESAKKLGSNNINRLYLTRLNDSVVRKLRDTRNNMKIRREMEKKKSEEKKRKEETEKKSSEKEEKIQKEDIGKCLSKVDGERMPGPNTSQSWSWWNLCFVVLVICCVIYLHRMMCDYQERLREEEWKAMIQLVKAQREHEMRKSIEQKIKSVQEHVHVQVPRYEYQRRFQRFLSYEEDT